MTLSDFAAPECQVRDCSADAKETRDHAEFGEVQVCSTCAGLFDDRGDA